VSTASAFGRSGFYRIVESGPNHWRVRNFKTLHELFHVNVDGEGRIALRSHNFFYRPDNLAFALQDDDGESSETYPERCRKYVTGLA
jgi:hypothetical protein